MTPCLQLGAFKVCAIKVLPELKFVSLSEEPASMVPIGGRPTMCFKDEVAEAFKQHIRNI